MSRKIAGLSLTLLFVSLSAKADPITSSLNSGRVQFSAAQSSFTTLGADGMLPLLGDNHQFVYGDLMGDYSTDDTYLMSPGLGYRAIVNNQIWGGYVFDDYERTSLGENFWVISPGVEWMNASWDAHVNGYFPIESQQQNGATDWADNYGDYQYGVPYGNSFDDARLTPYAVIGNGVDTEVGYSFDQGDHLRSRVFLGGYYYHPQDAYDVDNISGATAGFTKAVTKNVTVSLLNSYDNVNRYTFGINLAVSFGGDSNEYSGNVEDRMLDPVERHIGIIDTGAGTYDQQSYQVTGFGTEHDNVGYVSPNGTGVGTYEDPAPLTQSSLDAFNVQFSDGALIFVQGGSNSDYTLDGALSLYSGQYIYGRTASYTAPAASDEQPQITAADESDAFYIGTFTTNNVNTISDVSIYGNNAQGYAGINILGSGVVTVSNVNISDFNATLGSAGVYAVNNTDQMLTLDISNSTFNYNGQGIYAENAGNGDLVVNVVSSTANYVTNNGLTFLNNTNSGATGNATLTVNDSQFLNTGITSGNDGIFITNGSNGTLSATIENSVFSGNRSNGLEIYNNANESQGEGSGTGAGEVTVTVESSTFSNNGHDPDGLGSGISIVNYGPSTTNVSVSDSTLSNNGKYGLSVNNAETSDANSIMNVNVANSSFVNNDAGYAIFGTANVGTSTTITIDYADTTFVGNTPTNQSDGDNITWISE